jgi:hypothetical protein
MPRVRVTASCEVAVKPRKLPVQPNSMPCRFMNSTKANRVKTNGRYFLPSWPMIELVRPSTRP